MITVIYRMKLPAAAQPAFSRAWREATAAILADAPGALGGELLRDQRDPDALAIVTRWTSVDAWREFWAKGPPEPQGDPERNEILMGLERIGGDPEEKRGRSC